ncbi:MAG: hypothetical protein KAT14_01525 [Candidatus Marinimicrobia bacterium]|nr:hypothetical protein [Candidatus Neomarinimicrobiota bacterium]
MNNKQRKRLAGVLTVIALILVMIGLAIEIYVVSIVGLVLILVMLFERSWQIRKLNKQIKDIKKDSNHETDDLQNEKNS